MRLPTEGRTKMNNRIQSLTTTLWRDFRSVETAPQSIDDHIEEAVNWLYASQDATGTGGSAACYNLVLGWESPYPETSGYIVPTLYDIADRYDWTEAADRATWMAEWLLTVQLPNGAFPAGKYSNGSEISYDPSVFNTGQILRGLTRAYDETGNERYRESARSAIEWLGDVQNNDGSWQVHDYNSLSHSYSSRISWPVLEAIYELDLNFGTNVASKNLRWVVDQQNSNGWFSKCAFKRTNDPYLHTICYTIRGLIESSLYLQGEISAKCEDAAIVAADKLRQKQLQDGILCGEFNSEWEADNSYYCLTGNAQMAIIWSRLQDLNTAKNYTSVIKDTIQFLQRQQTQEGPKTITGGIQGSTPIWGPYMYLRYPNWACKFFIDALLEAKQLNMNV